MQRCMKGRVGVEGRGAECQPWIVCERMSPLSAAGPGPGSECGSQLSAERHHEACSQALELN